MNYLNSLKAIDPIKALKFLKLEATPQGAYLYFPCPSCGNQAAIKAYAEKKNLIFCKHCKYSDHIIKLTMETQSLDWEGAKNALLENAVPIMFNRLDKPIGFEYELTYTKFFEGKGLSKEFCERMEIGYPKGKTMLAGSIAFAVHNDDGVHIASEMQITLLQKCHTVLYVKDMHYNEIKKQATELNNYFRFVA